MATRLAFGKGVVDANASGNNIPAEQPSYEFDGVSSYATIPDWTPNGRPFEVEVSAVPLTVDGAQHKLTAGGTSNTYNIELSGANQWAATFISDAGAASVGQAASINLLSDATGAALTTTTGSGAYPAGYEPLSYIVDTIATRFDKAVHFFHGPIYNLKLTDNSPIQDTWVNYGNAARYGVLDEPIVLDGDFEIELDAIKGEATTVATWEFIGDAASTSFFAWFGSGLGSSDALQIYSGGVLVGNVAAGMDNIAIGQHFTQKISRVGGTWTVETDGVVQGTDTTSGGDFTISAIGDGRLLGRATPTDSALKNISIKDLSTGRDWFYALSPGNITGSVGNTGLLTFPADLGGGVYGYDGISGAQVPTRFGISEPEITIQSLTATPSAVDATQDTMTLVLDTPPVTQPVTLVYPYTGKEGDSKADVLIPFERDDELVVNGDFATGSDWTTSGGWSIGGGVASQDGSASGNLTQTGVCSAGKFYEISGDVVTLAAGNIGVRLGDGSANIFTVASVGHFSQVVTAGSSDTSLVFRTAEECSVDNISVKEVGVNRWVGTVPFAGKTFAEAAAKSESVGTTWTEKGYTYTALDIVNTGNTAAEEGVDYPIYDTVACFGDGARYVSLDNPIVLDGDFEIEFDWIRQNHPSADFSAPIGDFIVLYDTDAANANRVTLRVGGSSRSLDNVLEDVAVGQHTSIVVRRINSSEAEVLVDRVSKGTVTATATGSVIIDRLYGNAVFPTSTLPAGSALQNIRIKDLTKEREWTYTLDEGTGTSANNTGTTQGNYDNLPMYDTTVLEGDGTRYIEMPSASYASTDDWRISADVVFDTTGNNRPWGNEAGTTGRLLLTATDAQLHDSVLVLTTPHGLSDGEHATFTAYRQGSTVYLEKNGVVLDSGSAGATAWSVDRIGRQSATGGYGSFQNVTLENITTGEYVQYKIDEGTGELIGAYNKQDVSVTNTGDASSVTSQPMWETNVLEGDGTRYIEIPQFSVGASDDFRVEFDCIKQDGSSGTAFWLPLGQSISTAGRTVMFNDSGNAGADDVSLYYTNDSATTWVDGLADVSIGQHFSLKIVATAGSTELFIDGASKGAKSRVASPVAVDLIGTGVQFVSSQKLPANSALQNVTLENLTTGEYVRYKIDEGSGTEIKAYDKNGDEIPALGDEGVVNGDFATGDNSGWTDINCTSEVVGGRAELTGTIENQHRLSQGIPTVVGNTYRGRATLQQGTTEKAMNVLVVGVLSTPAILPATPTLVEFEFVATSTTTTLRVGTAGSTPIGDTCFVDDISVREVTTGTVTPDASWSYTTYGGTVTPDSSWLAIPEYTNDGSWTPDTDWQYVYPYGTDGQWTPDTDWQFIEDNTRYYPMNDQSSTLRCIDGTGSLVPSKAGTIQNYDPTDWSNS